LQGNALDRIDAHNFCAVLGQAGATGPIEFLVRHRHYVLFEFESHCVLFAHKICNVLGWSNVTAHIALRTLICRVSVVEESVHAAFGPHQDNVFGASQRFPQLLIECALQQQIAALFAFALCTTAHSLDQGYPRPKTLPNPWI
jgi:hypothetical protein